MTLPRILAPIETVPEGPARQAHPAAPPTWLVLLAAVALFGLALAPRLTGLEQHLTADDQEWVRRVARFSRALQQGDLADTYQSGHPGLPVLWLSALAFGPERGLVLADLARALPALEKSPLYLPALFDARRVLATVSAGLVVLLAGLTWRLLGAGPALLAGLLLAGEPFLVAHGRLLHTDPLLALLLAASLLAVLVFLEDRGGWRWLLGSGLATGLAISTKAPGVLLLGFVPLLGLVWFLARRGRFARAGPAGPPDLVSLVLPLAGWGLAAGAIFFLLWPALWVEPVETLERLARAVRGVGESPRRWGNFFLGQVYTEDVGPLFYLVATPLRLSPITLLGLVLLVVKRPAGNWCARWLRRVNRLAPPSGSAAVSAAPDEGGRGRPRSRSLPQTVAQLASGAPTDNCSRSVEQRATAAVAQLASGAPAGNRAPLLALAAAVALFTLMMSLSPKKLDRYLLPVFPTLVILAAAGWWPLLRARFGPTSAGFAAGLLGVLQLLLVASVQPYPLSFFNPLLGGPTVARQTIIVGWGEGTDQVAAYLNRQPDAERLVVTSLYHDLIHPLFRGRGVPPWDWREADYLAQYINMDQRNLAPEPLQPLVRETAPEYTVRINGLEYVRLYRIPPELKSRPDRGNNRGASVPKP